MRVTMYAAPGVGLAAPQIGEALQLAVLEDGPRQWGHLSEGERKVREREILPFTVLVNPTYEAIGDEESVSFYEGCLSVPGLTGAVARHRSVRVSALDERGDPVNRVFSGWSARIIQHEVDHLAGVLYLDKVESRSLSTVENFANLWVGRSLQEIANELGFAVF
jgi:peptide deformylase